MMKIKDIQETLDQAIVQMKKEISEPPRIVEGADMLDEVEDGPSCSETFLFVLKAMKELADHLAKLEEGG